MKKDHGLLPRRVEGVAGGRWILMDYLDVVVHVFTPETREFYALERLWGEVPARARDGVAPGNDERPPRRTAFEVELGGSNPRPLPARQALSQLSYSPGTWSAAIVTLIRLRGSLHGRRHRRRHGQIARRLTRLLAARGDRVRGLIRNPDHAADLEADGAEPVVAGHGGRGRPRRRTCAGADAVVFAAGAGPGQRAPSASGPSTSAPR